MWSFWDASDLSGTYGSQVINVWKKDIFSRYILTPTKFNCTLGNAQILEQIPKKSPNFFLNGIIMMKYLIQKQDLIQTLLRYLDQINCSSPW